MTRVDPGGPARPAQEQASPARRARVVVVTRHWGDAEGEAAAATRFVAGALARHAEVVVIRLDPALAGVPAPEPAVDSVFTVYEVPIYGYDRVRARVLEAALAAHDGGYRVPPIGAHMLQRLQGVAPDVPLLIARLSPDAVLLAGSEQPYNLDVLGRPGESGRPRVVVAPMAGDVRYLRSPVVERLLVHADAVATVHPGEHRALTQVPEAAGRAALPEVVPVDLALSVNRGSAEHRLFGVRSFGPYVVLLRRFPAGGPRFSRTVTHEVLREVVQPLSVAEIDGIRWRITNASMTLDLPVGPSRVNLWRLLAHARAVVDVRPPGPVGREAIEAMMLAVPSLVPDGSAAKEHVAAGNGGLWYADHAELVDELRSLADDGLRRSLGAAGVGYATSRHGRMDDFVARMAALVLGRAPAAPSRS